MFTVNSLQMIETLVTKTQYCDAFPLTDSQ